ncbi:ABC transporter permease [Sinobaca sp. H24]|uniref:ABC transporter permease n=1 Tax=Sinobaca sp. H24 TaxID=2923376 RepID=UPI00207AFCE5|nr:ABC transporter permease [Sinobaca sp. H24]
MRPFLIKDFKIMLRDRSELVALLLMPFIIMGILGTALSGVMEGDTSSIDIQLAVVEEDAQQEGIAAFQEQVRNSGMPPEAEGELTAAAEQMNPVRLLNNMLEDPELAEMIHVQTMEQSDAEAAVHAGDVDAVLTFPEHFTEDTLNAMLMNNGNGSELELLVSDEGSINTTILEDLLAGFTDNLNAESAIAAAGGEEAASIEIGGTETLSQNEPVSAMQYYSIGMAVMFVLYVAGTIASKAFVEKQQQVYNRIILSGTKTWKYLAGKIISTAVIAFVQLTILFILSALVFRTFELTSFSFWIGMLGISAVLAVCVGCMGGLLTSLSIRTESDTASGVFTGVIVTLFAFAGGSFFPLDGMPAFISAFGSWTPNGAAMNAYIRWVQGFGWSELAWPIMQIGLVSIAAAIISFLVFPRRRSVSS